MIENMLILYFTDFTMYFSFFRICFLVSGSLFFQKIQKELDFVYLNGHPEKRWFGNINLSFAFVEGESLLLGLRDVACSSGSACTSASLGMNIKAKQKKEKEKMILHLQFPYILSNNLLEPSYVLRAVGVGDDLAHTSIRFGFGRFTTEEETDYAADEVIKSVKRYPFTVYFFNYLFFIQQLHFCLLIDFL